MNIKWYALLPLMGLLNACSWNHSNPTSREMIYPIDYGYTEETFEPYQEAQPLPRFVKTAEVPQTHTSAKSLDNEWIRRQNPQEYTIMLTAKEQPLAISQELMETPKNQRSAAFKYQQYGKVYYTGVWGNYSDAEKAQQSLENLPSTVRQQAQVVKWNQVQSLDQL